MAVAYYTIPCIDSPQILKESLLFTVHRYVLYAQVKSFRGKLLLDWWEGTCIPTDKLLWGSDVVLDGLVFCTSSILSKPVLQYDPMSGCWSELPASPKVSFTVASLNG